MKHNSYIFALGEKLLTGIFPEISLNVFDFEGWKLMQCGTLIV